MDTSGANFNPKNVAKPTPDFSKEELSAILKFGAQNMYVVFVTPMSRPLTH